MKIPSKLMFRVILSPCIIILISVSNSGFFFPLWMTFSCSSVWLLLKCMRICVWYIKDIISYMQHINMYYTCIVLNKRSWVINTSFWSCPGFILVLLEAVYFSFLLSTKAQLSLLGCKPFSYFFLGYQL
jgi:hypothetical protein